MNRRAKLDAASIIIGEEICNSTNKQTNKQTNKETNKQKNTKQTVTDISTPCLSACVDLLARLVGWSLTALSTQCRSYGAFKVRLY